MYSLIEDDAFLEKYNTIWDKVSVTKSASAAGCTSTFWTSACVPKPTSSAFYRWWWLCYKVKADIKKEFDSELFYNKNYLKTKVKSLGDKVTDFYDKKIPKVDCKHSCSAVITILVQQ